MNKQNQQALAQQHLETQLSSLRTSLVVEVTKLSADASAQVERGLRRVVDVAQQIEQAVKALPAAIAAAQPKPAPASRLCSACKHCVPQRDLVSIRLFGPHKFKDTFEYAKCKRPSSPNSDFLVSGHQTDGFYCSTERKSDAERMCGETGRFFEAKQ